MVHGRSAFLMRFLLVTAIVAGALAVPVAAQTPPPLSFGVRAGEYTNAGSAFFGVELLAPIGYNWWFNPNAEGVFVDHGHLYTGNFDFSYEIPVQRPFRVWLGGGPAIVFRSIGGQSPNRTDAGFDVLAGIGLRAGPVVPYLQAKALISNTSDFVLAFGVRF
jgi:hypothetical protein